MEGERVGWLVYGPASLRFHFELVPQPARLGFFLSTAPRQSDVTTLGTSSSQENNPRD